MSQINQKTDRSWVCGQSAEAEMISLTCFWRSGCLLPGSHTSYATLWIQGFMGKFIKVIGKFTKSTELVFLYDGQPTNSGTLGSSTPHRTWVLGFSPSAFQSKSCNFWSPHRLSRVAFYRVGQEMDSGYFMLDEAKDLLTVSVLTKCVVQSSVMDCLNRLRLLSSLLIMESPVDIDDLLLLWIPRIAPKTAPRLCYRLENRFCCQLLTNVQTWAF